jgi:exopolysaccharide biosynthesis protein
MSLVELGRWMGRLGATSAANLDGGGSTTVWVRGAGVVNRPSDPTGERPVGNGLFVVGR